MSFAPSVLSLAAAGVYGFVMLACIVAGIAASRGRQMRRHVRAWLLIALLFAVFMALRLTAAEEMLRETVRASLRASGEYGERRNIQALIVSAMIAAAGIGMLGWIYKATRNLQGRRNLARLAANLAAVAMIFLLALRIASLHLIDTLLYGPLKLNWVIDIGSSMVVMAAAVYYTRLVRARP